MDDPPRPDNRQQGEGRQGGKLKKIFSGGLVVENETEEQEIRATRENENLKKHKEPKFPSS